MMSRCRYIILSLASIFLSLLAQSSAADKEYFNSNNNKDGGIIEKKTNLRIKRDTTRTTTDVVDDSSNKIRIQPHITSFPLEDNRRRQQEVISKPQKIEKMSTIGSSNSNQLQQLQEYSKQPHNNAAGTSTLSNTGMQPLAEHPLQSKKKGKTNNNNAKLSIQNVNSEETADDSNIDSDSQSSDYDGSENIVRVEVQCEDTETLLDCLDDVIFATQDANVFEVKHKLKRVHAISVSISESDIGLLNDFDTDYSVRRYPLHIPDSLEILDHRKLQRAQNTPEGHEMIQASQFWSQYGKKGEGVRVCVLDTGIDANHEDLGNLNGFGVDANVANWQTDVDGHGTHVSGTIGALDNNIGIVGVAPEAELFTIKVFNDNTGGFFDDDLLEAVEACADNNANIISMSLGGAGSIRSEQNLMNRLFTEENILLVAAAGNNGQRVNIFPAAYQSVLSVASVGLDGERSDFSTHNLHVDIAAPGENIISTYPGNRYARLSGTSMATPHVSGVAALVLSNMDGEVDVSDLVEALQETAEDKGNNGRDNFYGHGIVHAVDAMRYLLGNAQPVAPPTPNPPTPNPPTPSPPNRPPSPACNRQQFDFKLELLTDSWADETSWDLVNHRTQEIVKSGGGFTDNTEYTEELCLNSNRCYTWVIHDEYDDGLCCNGEGKDGSYQLLLDGEVVKEGAEFRDNEFATFGDCNCVPLVIELETDFWASEIKQSLIMLNEQVEVWGKNQHNSNWSYTTRFQCLDPNVCYRFQITDSAGDGIKPGGNLRVEYGGEQLYNGGNYGDGGFLDFGPCLNL